MPGGGKVGEGSSSGKKLHRDAAMPYIGNNIDGIPLGNRSPPRNSSSNSGGSDKQNNN